MGRHYRQLGVKERSVIGHLHAGGRSIREIARQIGRDVATVSRELRRNSQRTKVWPGGYDPERAQQLAERRRRWDARFKLVRQPALQQHVRERLAMGYSPEQIAGRLAREEGHTVISHESIYRFIYHRSAQKDYWHRLLPRGKHRRGHYGKRGGSPASFIRDRRSIHDRPARAADRQQPGHWEADLMLFARYGEAVLVLHERTSRLTLMTRLADKTADGVAARLTHSFARLPPALRQTVTVDNGTEFARHYRLPEGTRTYFCDVRAPWQKGGVENAIGRLRRYLPRKTRLDSLSNRQLDAIAQAYNMTPRKCLGYLSPAEAFQNQLLHFKRESTSRRAPE